MPKKLSFADKVADIDAAKNSKETGNVVKKFAQKETIKKKSQRVCVLVDPDVWRDFKKCCSEKNGITASAQINLFIRQFLANESDKQ